MLFGLYFAMFLKPCILSEGASADSYYFSQMVVGGNSKRRMHMALSYVSRQFHIIVNENVRKR